MVKTKLKKDDVVVVIAGSEKGKRGKILFIDRKKGRVIVEGINKKTKHIKNQGGENQGGRVQIEYPFEISNVMFFDEKTKSGSKLGIQKTDKAKSRVSKKSGKSID